MDFAFQPPEINSARMYSGAGSGSLISAAVAWQSVAAELSATAAMYGSIVSALPWFGSSSAAMISAVSPYIAWMNLTAEQATQSATAAMSAVGAFETAFASTVHPAVVSANRVQLLSLVATNLLGQNTPAIMVTEAHYLEMWAQDIAAMVGYQGGSAAATGGLPQFLVAPATTNPASFLGGLGGIFDTTSFIGSTFQSFLQSGGPFVIPVSVATLLVAIEAVQQTTDAQATAAAAAAGAAGTPPVVAVTPPLVPAIIAPAISNADTTAFSTAKMPAQLIRASVGSGNTIGALTTPASWKPLTVQPAAVADSTSTPIMPMGSSFAGPGGTPGRVRRPPPEYGFKPQFMPQPPAGG
jgi:PPE-repeat protein